MQPTAPDLTPTSHRWPGERRSKSRKWKRGRIGITSPSRIIVDEWKLDDLAKAIIPDGPMMGASG
jgi:hypothetical protein